MQQGQAPHVFSMASWKQCQCNERLLDVFMEKFALDPTDCGAKLLDACYLRTEELTALSPPDFCLNHCSTNREKLSDGFYIAVSSPALCVSGVVRSIAERA